MNIKERIRLIPVALLGAFMLFSCTDDVIEPVKITGSTTNTVYINTGFTSTTLGPNVFQTSPLVSFTSVVSGALSPVRFLVQCTQPASEDIRVQLGKDPEAMVAGWLDFPGSVSIFNKPEYVILKGETMSRDTVVLSVADADLVTIREGKFMYPFKITSVVGKAGISSTLSKGALYADITFSNNAAATPTGTVMNPKPAVASDTAWTLVATRADSEAMTLTNVAFMFDDITTTSTYASTGNVSESGILPFTLDIDLQKQYTGLTGLRILTSANGYRLTGMRLYVKNAADDPWVSQGPTITFANNSTHAVRFHSPVDARFIRCEIISVQNQTNGLRITDFNIYRNSWE